MFGGCILEKPIEEWLLYTDPGNKKELHLVGVLNPLVSKESCLLND